MLYTGNMSLAELTASAMMAAFRLPLWDRSHPLLQQLRGMYTEYGMYHLFEVSGHDSDGSPKLCISFVHSGRRA